MLPSQLRRDAVFTIHRRKVSVQPSGNSRTKRLTFLQRTDLNTVPITGQLYEYALLSQQLGSVGSIPNVLPSSYLDPSHSWLRTHQAKQTSLRDHVG